MLSTMREKTKIVMLVLLVAMVGWLIFDVGMGGGTGAMGGTPDLGSVNGRPIRYLEWQQAYQQAYEQARAQNPGVMFTREDQRELENQAFESLVQAELLQAEYRRRGIVVTDREIVDAVRQFPPPEVVNAPDFQTDGQFDPAKYERFLTSSNANTREYLLAMEARYRDELPRLKLLQQVTADIYVPDAKLWQIFRDQNDSVTVRALIVEPRRVAADASIAMTDEEVRRYYDSNRADFNQPARAYMHFTVLPRLPTAVDSAQIMDRARALRDSIVRGVADFASVARTESSDSSSGAQGGSLGTIGRGQTVEPFDRAAFSLPLNRVSEPVVTTFGVHLIRVDSRTADSAAVSHILLPWERIGARLDSLEAQADSLDRYAAEQSDGTLLDSVARRMGMPVAAGPVLYQGVPYVLGRYRIPDVGIWAFEARPRETSPVVETSGGFYVFRLDSVLPAGTPPLAEVEQEVRTALLNRKRIEAAEAIAREAEQRITGGQTMEQVATAMGMEITTIGPFNRTANVPLLGTATPLVGTAFRLRTGERSRMLSTGQAFVMLRADRRVSADSAAWLQQLDQQRGQITRLARQVRVQSFLTGLRRGANVRDRRAEVLRPAAVDDLP